MKSLLRLLTGLGLVLASAGPGAAQLLSRLPLELHARLGAGLPTGGFAEQSPGIGAEAGAAWEVGGILRPVPWLGAYGAYQQDRFGCAVCGDVGIDPSAVASGWEAGAHLSLPVERFGIRPWLRGGVVQHTLRFSRGRSALRSDPGLGYGVGGGLEIAAVGVRLAPGVRYQSYPADIDFAGYASRSLDVSHLTFDLGLILPF